MKIKFFITLASIITFTSFTTSCEEPKNKETKETSYESYAPRLTTNSNGYDWNNATNAQKKSLSRQLSNIVRRNNISDCSPNFYFDALNEAYNTSSNLCLSQKISDVAGQCTGMAQSLPASSRNY